MIICRFSDRLHIPQIRSQGVTNSVSKHVRVETQHFAIFAMLMEDSTWFDPQQNHRCMTKATEDMSWVMGHIAFHIVRNLLFIPNLWLFLPGKWWQWSILRDTNISLDVAITSINWINCTISGHVKALFLRQGWHTHQTRISKFGQCAGDHLRMLGLFQCFPGHCYDSLLCGLWSLAIIELLVFARRQELSQLSGGYEGAEGLWISMSPMKCGAKKLLTKSAHIMLKIFRLQAEVLITLRERLPRQRRRRTLLMHVHRWPRSQGGELEVTSIGANPCSQISFEHIWNDMK